MRFKKRVYILFSRILPKLIKDKFYKVMQYSGIDEEFDAPMGAYVICSLVLGLLFFSGYYSFFDVIDVICIVGGVVGFCLALYLFYLGLAFKVERRKKLTEDSLPDFLQLVSSNLKAGMTPYKALRVAGKIDFGPLSEEINRISKRSMGVNSWEDEVLGISKRIRSNTLERALQLFVTSMRSVGNLAKLLGDLAEDLTEAGSLKKELLSSTKTYTLFIFFSVLVGTPLLLAISVNFIERISKLSLFQSSNAASLAGLQNVELLVTVEFLFWLSVVLLFFSCLFACMFMGVIKDGRRSSGFKMVIPMYLISLAIFLSIKYFIQGFL